MSKKSDRLLVKLFSAKSALKKYPSPPPLYSNQNVLFEFWRLTLNHARAVEACESRGRKLSGETTESTVIPVKAKKKDEEIARLKGLICALAPNYPPTPTKEQQVQIDQIVQHALFAEEKIKNSKIGF